MLETLFINIFLTGAVFSSLFFQYDGFKYMQAFNFLVVVIYNIIDVRQQTDKEYSSFLDLVHIDKQSMHLSNFVDRLMPKHVLFFDSDIPVHKQR